MPLVGRRGFTLPTVGELRDWLDVLQPTWTVDALRGQVEGEPTITAHVPVKIETLDGEERMQGDQITSALQWWLMLRYQTGISVRQKVRVFFNASGETRTMEVLSVRPIHPNWLELIAAEVAS